MTKRPYRRYVTASSRPTEQPNRTVGLLCACCGYLATVPLTVEAMTDIPLHCDQPMLINGAAPPAGVRRPTAFL